MRMLTNIKYMYLFPCKQLFRGKMKMVGGEGRGFPARLSRLAPDNLCAAAALFRPSLKSEGVRCSALHLVWHFFSSALGRVVT